MIIDFIREHADQATDGLRWGVEPICRILTEYGAKIAPSTFYEWKDKLPTARQKRDEALLVEINRVHQENFGVYGARKIWLQLNREGIPVARCTGERLMRQAGLAGITRGKAKRTTNPDPAAPLPEDLVRRDSIPIAPNLLWVADITYVSTWAGWVYVAFVTDAYARRILGWSTGTTMSKQLVLNALNQAVWIRQRENHGDFNQLIHHSDRSSQYTCLALSERLAETGIAASVGAVGSSYDNALAETINGLYKTELIKPRKPWRSVDDVEYATAEWVDWYNHRRLYEYCGDMPPAEAENIHYYSKQAVLQPAELTQQ